jgi:hypothetical protein
MLLKLSKKYETFKAGKVIDVEPLKYQQLVQEGYTSYVQLNTLNDGNNRNSTRVADGRVRRRSKGSSAND